MSKSTFTKSLSDTTAGVLSLIFMFILWAPAAFVAFAVCFIVDGVQGGINKHREIFKP